MTLQDHLKNIGACEEARQWAGTRSALEAWEQCERADWLLWWAAKTPANDHQGIVRAACACARRALVYTPSGEERPRLAIEAAEAWTENPNDATAADAARAAADVAAADVAWADAAWAADAAAAAGAAVWASEHIAMCKVIRAMLRPPWMD